MGTSENVSAETAFLTTFEDNPFSQVASRIMSEAYQRAGYETEIIFLPGKRALQASSEGKADGEVSRIYKIGELFPSLIRVDLPYMNLKGMAFVIRDDVIIKQQSDLSKYKIGSLRGAVFSDIITKGFDVSLANTPAQLLKILVNNRVDVIITNEIETRVLIAKLFPDVGIFALDPPLVEIPIYHYVHISKQHRVTAIKEALQDRIKQDRIKQIREIFFREHNIAIN